jgi:hypothetical protein
VELVVALAAAQEVVAGVRRDVAASALAAIEDVVPVFAEQAVILA